MPPFGDESLRTDTVCRPEPRAYGDALAAPTRAPVAVADAYTYCRDVARQLARTFYYGSRFLPPDQRAATWAIYAFCRIADDIVDEGASVAESRGRLASWCEALIATYRGTPRGPVMTAWADMLTRFPVPLAPALELLDGVAMDLEPRRYPTFAALHQYCYRVAGTVGLLMAPVLGYEHPSALTAAVDLGVAMQLTNILRDVGEDLARGRIYLPTDELERFGYRERDLHRRVVTPAFVALMEFQIARAEEYYQRGLAGVTALRPDSRLAIALSATLYRAIHGRIRRNGYDVFRQRAHVPLAGKLAAVPRVWLALRRSTDERPLTAPRPAETA
jgi:phytoene synthase